MKGRSALFLFVGLWLYGTEWCIADGQVYRWVDADGQIIYSDQLPPAQATTEHTVISEKGRVVTVVGGPDAEGGKDSITEQGAHAGEDSVEQQARAAEAIRQQVRDRALLQIYGGLDEIRFARDNKLAQLDSRIESMRSSVSNAQERVTVLEGHAASGAYNKLPQNYERELASLKRDIKVISDQLALEVRNREQVQEQFEADIARYAELKADKKADKVN